MCIIPAKMQEVYQQDLIWKIHLLTFYYDKKYLPIVKTDGVHILGFGLELCLKENWLYKMYIQNAVCG